VTFLRFGGLASLPASIGLALSFGIAPSAGCGGNEFVAGSGEGGLLPDGAPASSSSGGGPSDDGGGSSGGGNGKDFCASLDASQYPFCSDLDPKPLPENWDQVVTPGSATVAEDPDASVSPPNSLLAIAPAQVLNDGGFNQAFVKKVTLPKGAVHIAFDVKVDQLSFPTGASAASSSVISLVYTQGKDYEVFLAFAPSTTSDFSLVLVELSTAPISIGDAGTTVTGHDLTKLLPASFLTSWLPMSLEFDLDHDAGLDTAATATITLGTQSTNVTLTPPLGTSSGDRTLTLGVQATGETGEARIHFDNITYGTD
jgi:hypothetical protein